MLALSFVHVYPLLMIWPQFYCLKGSCLFGTQARVFVAILAISILCLYLVCIHYKELW